MPALYPAWQAAHDEALLVPNDGTCRYPFYVRLDDACLRFIMEVAQAGRYELLIQYRCEENDLCQRLVVNGIEYKIGFSASQGRWKTARFSIPLLAGRNEVQLLSHGMLADDESAPVDIEALELLCFCDEVPRPLWTLPTVSPRENCFYWAFSGDLCYHLRDARAIASDTAAGRTMTFTVDPCAGQDGPLHFTDGVACIVSAVQVDLVWQGSPLEGYELLVIVDTSGFTTSYWDGLRAYAHGGGKLFWMFDGNSGLNVYFREIFGLEVQSPARWHGAVPAGTTAVMRLETEAREAEPLACVADGTPLLSRNGGAWFLAMQWSDGLLACAQDEFESHPLHRVVEHVVHESGIERPVRVENINIEVSRLVDEEAGDVLYLLINHSNHPRLYHNRPDATGLSPGWL